MSTSSRPICPYCNSKQTRFASSKSNILKSQYTCKNCGQSFSVENELYESKGGCFKFFFKLIFWVVIVAIGFSIYLAKFDNTPNKSQSSTQLTEKKNSDSSDKEEFSPEAEKAAHEYIPTEEDYKKHESIADSKDQSDTLNISTTIRNKD
ncbi:hypothetical protein [Acinetobacter baumannii]|uniref:hypothetical protein n=1 Tax=Acinetobacter baumannii TaxID=470 RepID=UPI003756F9F7